MAQRSDFDDLGIDAVFFMDQIVHGNDYSRHSIFLFRHEGQEYIIHSSYSPHGTVTRMVDGSQYIDAYGFVNEDTVHVVIDTLNLPLSFGFQPDLLIQQITSPNFNVGSGVYRFMVQNDTLEAVFKRFEEVATIPLVSNLAHLTEMIEAETFPLRIVISGKEVIAVKRAFTNLGEVLAFDTVDLRTFAFKKDTGECVQVTLTDNHSPETDAILNGRIPTLKYVDEITVGDGACLVIFGGDYSRFLFV